MTDDRQPLYADDPDIWNDLPATTLELVKQWKKERRLARDRHCKVCGAVYHTAGGTPFCSAGCRWAYKGQLQG
jgi:hypothetical protein